MQNGNTKTLLIYLKQKQFANDRNERKMKDFTMKTLLFALLLFVSLSAQEITKVYSVSNKTDGGKITIHLYKDCQHLKKADQLYEFNLPEIPVDLRKECKTCLKRSKQPKEITLKGRKISG